MRLDLGVGEGGDHDDGRLGAAPAQLLKQLQAIHVRHAVVGDHAASLAGRAPVQEVRAGLEGHGLDAVGLDQGRDRLAHRRIVVDHRDHRRLGLV